ncbi:MAG: DUF456 domain-containing protein [Panacagrimonas sp.]
MDNLELLIGALALIAIVIGLAGAVLPALPGVPLVFGGLWALAWIGHYELVGPFTLTILGVLLAAGVILDFTAGSLGARKFGASPKAVAGATLGAFVGIFFGLPGLILGPFVGAVLGEIRSRRGVGQAAASGVGAWAGLLVGILYKLGISVMMVAIFAFDYFV